MVTSNDASLKLDQDVLDLLTKAHPEWNGVVYFELLSKLANTFIKKNADYVGLDQFDCLKDFREADELGTTPILQILGRAKDKWSRLLTLARTQTTNVQDEGLMDTCLDMANYMLIIAMLLKLPATPKTDILQEWHDADRDKILNITNVLCGILERLDHLEDIIDRLH